MELPITALCVGLVGLWAGRQLWRALPLAESMHYIVLTVLMLAVMEWHGMKAVFLYSFVAVVIAGMIRSEEGARRAWIVWPLLLGSAILLYIWFVETWLF